MPDPNLLVLTFRYHEPTQPKRTGKHGRDRLVVAIARELKIPVKFIGLGEQVDDLQPFDPKSFAEALFAE